jgi:hypothetical protein
LEYSRYDINGYRFRTAKLEASRQLVATCNSGVVTSDEDASRVAADCYGILQKIIEYTFGGTKELKVVFFQCDWFDLIHGTREDDVYQEGIEEHENFMVSDGARLTELATRDIELMEEEQGPSKKHLRKS